MACDDVVVVVWPFCISRLHHGIWMLPHIDSIFLLLLFGSAETTRRGEHFPELLEAFFLFEAVDIPPGGLGVTSIELQCLYKQTN